MFRLQKWSIFWIVMASLQELLSPYLIKWMIEWISNEDFEW